MTSATRLHFDRIMATKTVYDPGLCMPFHKDDFSRISITLDGGSDEQTDIMGAFLPAGTLLTKPNTTQHQTVFGKKATTILSIQFPDESLFPAAFKKWEWYRHPDLTILGIRLWTELKAARNDKMVNTVLARLNQMIEKLERLKKLQLRLSRVAAVLSGPAETNRSVNQVSEELSLHRVYLSRAFTKEYGVPPSHYARQQRLLNAVIALYKTEKLAGVAYGSGFSDQSHMNRSLKKAFDLTPAALRTCLQQ